MPELVPLIIGVVFTALCSAAIGFDLGDAYGRRQRSAQDVDAYIKNFWPDRHAAYHRGITEGYQQGLRDARDHNEPA